MDPRTLSDLRLIGERVALVPVRPEHARLLFPLIHRRRAVLRWLIWEGPESEAELAGNYSAWTTAAKDAVGVHLSILELASERPVGTIGLRFPGAPTIGDVGYWVGEEAWGRGLGTEAVRLLAWLAFTELAVTSLCAWVDVGNQASRRVLERNGFVLETTVPGRAQKRDRAVDQWGFALTPADWRRARAGHPEPELQVE